jgi:disulfide oxidoreductase YuzD
MSKSVLVQIIGAPIACADGVKDTWREVAHWVAGQLKARFDGKVQVKYYDLFDADCPSMPAGAQLPLVLVNGEVTLNGGKIAVPVIRRKIESALEKESIET